MTIMESRALIERIDIIIRILLSSSSGSAGKSQTGDDNINSDEILKFKDKIEEEDKPKLAGLLEDLVVLLKDDPDNKRDIRQIYNKIMNGYGHLKPISEILATVKSNYL
jgi:hypothetical protein